MIAKTLWVGSIRLGTESDGGDRERPIDPGPEPNRTACRFSSSNARPVTERMVKGKAQMRTSDFTSPTVQSGSQPRSCFCRSTTADRVPPCLCGSASFPWKRTSRSLASRVLGGGGDCHLDERRATGHRRPRVCRGRSKEDLA